MTTIYLWGANAEEAKDQLKKELRMKWSKKKKQFYREKVDRKALKRITSYCMKNKINYRTSEGQSYRVIESEFLDTSSRELRDWGTDISRGTPYLDEIDYEQMWDEHKD